MSRPALLYPDPDVCAERVAQVSHDAMRELQAALAPRRAMTNAERRENLLGLAEIVIREFDWDVDPVVRPSLRPLVRYWATTADPLPPFARLLLAVSSCNGRDTDKALARLVPDGQVAA